MQAIEVKFLPPTANLGIRYHCYCAAAGTIHSQEFLDIELTKNKKEISQDNRATMIAQMLANYLGWTENLYGKMVMGGLKNGNWVFVFTGRNEQHLIK